MGAIAVTAAVEGKERERKGVQSFGLSVFGFVCRVG